MKVGDLVTLKGDPHGVMGVIIEARYDIRTKRAAYFVSWVCDMCDDAWGDAWQLEVVEKK